MTLTTPPPPPVGVERCHGLFSSDYAVMKSFDHLTASVFLARSAYQTGCVTIFLHRPRRVTLLERSLLRRGATWYLRLSVCSCVSLWVFMQCPIGGLEQILISLVRLTRSSICSPWQTGFGRKKAGFEGTNETDSAPDCITPITVMLLIQSDAEDAN